MVDFVPPACVFGGNVTVSGGEDAQVPGSDSVWPRRPDGAPLTKLRNPSARPADRERSCSAMGSSGDTAVWTRALPVRPPVCQAVPREA